jgi:signal transduction histidine kinase
MLTRLQQDNKYPLLIILPFLLSLLLFSCSRKTVDLNISPAFQKALDHAAAMRDTGAVLQSLDYIDSSERAMRPLCLRDLNEYYVYKYNVYMANIRDFDKAMSYADSMIWSIERNDVREQMQGIYAEAQYRRGDALFEKQSYNSAYRAFYNAKSLLDNSDSCILSHYNYRMGMVFYRQKHFEDAISSFQSAYRESEKCGNDFEIFYKMQELLDNIGLSFSNNNMPDSAIAYYRKALSFIDNKRPAYTDKPEMFFDKARAIVFGNLATAYLSRGMRNEAETLFKKSINISIRKGYDVVDGQLSRLKLTRLYYEENNYDSAFAVLNSVRRTLDSVPSRDVLAGWYNLMWQYYDKKGQTKPAFDYLLSYSKLEDSLREENIKLRSFDIRNRIKFYDTQTEITTLQKKSDRRRNLMIFAITVSVMAVIILILILQNLKRSKKNVHVLTTLNTYIRNQNHRLEEVLGQLEASNKEKDRILRTVAHDIRNPIAAISTITGVLLEHTENYTDKQKEYLSLIETACTNALLLSNEILEATNIIKKDQLSKEMLNIGALLINTIDLLRFRAVEKNQHLLVSISDNLGDIAADKEKLNRAISNLIINAIKFSPEAAEIKVTAVREENFVLISIIDQGIGIPDDIKDKVFDIFSEGKREGTAGEKPFGLGLSITQQIILAHGGTIWFEANANGGTTFYIHLPV